MKIEPKCLYELLSAALSIEILGYIDIGYGPCGAAIPYDDESYKEFLGDDADKKILGIKFMKVVRQFIEDESNDICIVAPRCTSWYPPIDHNTYIKIDGIQYTLDENQTTEYHKLVREANVIKAGQYLVQVLSIPLTKAVAFAKENRYLPYKGLQ